MWTSAPFFPSFFTPVLLVSRKHSTFALSGFFAFNHDVNGSSLSSSCLCRACHHTGRWLDWISQPAIKNFIVTLLAQFFCLLKAVIQGCSHPTTLHRICFLALRAKNSKWINWTDSSAGYTETGNEQKFYGICHSISPIEFLEKRFLWVEPNILNNLCQVPWPWIRWSGQEQLKLLKDLRNITKVVGTEMRNWQQFGH